MRSRLRRRVRGLTEKNRARLGQFDDPRAQLALLELPDKLLRLAEREDRPAKAARLVQTALLVQLLLMAPVRMRNLRGLRPDRHLVRPPGRKRGGGGAARLVIPEGETKNGEPLEFPLPPELVRTLDLYLGRHRRHLAARRGRGLAVPGRQGRPQARGQPRRPDQGRGAPPHRARGPPAPVPAPRRQAAAAGGARGLRGGAAAARAQERGHDHPLLHRARHRPRGGGLPGAAAGAAGAAARGGEGARRG